MFFSRNDHRGKIEHEYCLIFRAYVYYSYKL